MPEPAPSLPANNWALYTLTAIAGVIAGIVGTQSSQGDRISRAELQLVKVQAQLDRIEEGVAAIQRKGMQ